MVPRRSVTFGAAGAKLWAMVLVAFALWVVATALVAVPVSLALRRLDEAELEEPVDPAELLEAMGRHPARRAKVA